MPIGGESPRPPRRKLGASAGGYVLQLLKSVRWRRRRRAAQGAILVAPDKYLLLNSLLAPAAGGSGAAKAGAAQLEGVTNGPRLFARFDPSHGRA